MAVVALTAGSCGGPEAPPVRRTMADVRLPVEIEVISATVPRAATLDSLLRANHLQDQLVTSAVAAARAVFDPRHLRADQPYKLVRTVDGLLRDFEYEIDGDRFLRIVNADTSRPDDLDAQVVPYQKRTDVVAIDAQIDADHPSLIAAIDATGERVPLALELADIFSGEVDFRSDLQPGDSFRVLFEKYSHDGQFSGYGNILGASIVAGGRRLQAFRWPAAVEKAAYYDENGRSLKRFFLKSPLKFEPDPRITSAFSLHRLHPIDHVVKAHLGVDYGAPMGAPVVAVANGTVLSASFSGASGNMVHLKHPDGFETYYLHLSAFGPGIRAGGHVGQGQLIGRVGMTGSATGPHLDFRIKRNGTFINPVAARSKQSPGEPIPAAQLAAFHASRDDLTTRLAATLRASVPAATADAIPAAGK
ncbi:MAG: peptidoglycan DD-metalloendopeptidase family protein [Vicinamibacterales bacterium]